MTDRRHAQERAKARKAAEPAERSSRRSPTQRPTAASPASTSLAMRAPLLTVGLPSRGNAPQPFVPRLAPSLSRGSLRARARRAAGCYGALESEVTAPGRRSAVLCSHARVSRVLQSRRTAPVRGEPAGGRSACAAAGLSTAAWPPRAGSAEQAASGPGAPSGSGPACGAGGGRRFSLPARWLWSQHRSEEKVAPGVREAQ